MKKISTLCIALLLAFVGTVVAQAQSFSYGIAAGYNLTKLTYSGSAKENSLWLVQSVHINQFV